MTPYKARGIVLNTIKYGDTSVVACILTDLFGRTSYMVQGIRSGRGKGNRAALLQPMFLLEYEGIPAVRSHMDRMKDVRLSPPLRSIPFDVRKSAISLFMAEVLYRLVRESQPDEALFGFVHDSVAALDVMERGVANFHLWFLVKLSAFLGFYPSGRHSASGYFDITEGAFVDYRPDHALVLEQQHAALLADLMECDALSLGDIPLSHGVRSAFLTSLLAYFDYHLDSASRIKSIRVLGEMF